MPDECNGCGEQLEANTCRVCDSQLCKSCDEPAAEVCRPCAVGEVDWERY